jgi:uncharacterized protein (TIGR02757 family)
MGSRGLLLRRYLDSLYADYQRSYLSTDPVEFLHRYEREEDIEVVGLIASGLAYGRVSGIRKATKEVLDRLGRSPFAFTARFNPARQKGLFSGFVHRFTRGPDIACLIYFARQMIEKEGSVRGFFLKGYSRTHKNVREALIAFSRHALSLDSTPVYGAKALPRDAGVRFLFPSPEDGSPCKRLNLYLRWMVRKDTVDFGIWKDVDPSKLIIPLDTHIARISANIGLTTRKTPDWKMAEEITGALRAFNPKDPVRYDFALSRLGILDKCGRRYDKRNCMECMLRDVCVL